MNKKLCVILLFAQAMMATESYSEETGFLQRVENSPYLHLVDEYDSDAKGEKSKNKETVTLQNKKGNIEITCEIENADNIPQSKEEWDKAKKKKEANKNSTDKKDADSPKASLSVSWSTEK